MKEIWKDIAFTDGKYSVSNLGNVRRNECYTRVKPYNNRTNVINHYKERILVPYKSCDNYLVVSLRVKDKSTPFKVHRLVAETFIPNPDILPCVNHKDENVFNNNVNNLEWCDYKYNANYGTRNIRISESMPNKKRVLQLSLNNEPVKVWDSLTQASKAYKANTTSYISRVCKGQRKSYKGYCWKYIE